MHRSRLVLSVLAALGLAAGASATTFVLPEDDQLADQAAVVVEGTVEAVGGVPDVARPLTEARVRIERQIKGRVPGSSLRVRVLGGKGADGRRLVIWGAPQFRAGERVLLFLVPHADGAYRPLHLALGAFHEVELAGRRLALREVGDALILAPGGGEARERARDFTGFGRWVADRAAGVRRAQDYFVELPAGPAKVVERFTFLGGQKHRWFQFDSGQNVGWRAHAGGQPLVPGGGFAEFQAGINAWNNDAGSNVRYRYDGTTTASNGFDGGFDGINAILFDDPNDEIAGGFSCQFPGQGTGVLAVGGAWSDDAVVRDGYLVIQGGDIVTNDGAGCWFNSSKRAEQVFGHELGHTLGLGHSCGDNSSGDCNTAAKRDALMRASAHPDERGAKLGTDDKEGIAFLYPVAGGGGGPKPAAPTGLTATAASSTSVQLAWTDNATNEQNYRVELKTTGNFTQVLQLPANSTAATLTGLVPSTLYTFRVRAKNASGFSPYSASASATTQAPPPPPVPAAPANLVATPLSSTQVLLAWEDKSTNETGFRLEVTDQRDPYLAIEVLPANTESFVVNGLGPDFPYTFRLRAENSKGASAYSNEASVTIPGAGPCVVTAQNLCLLGGRFRVMVHWRIPATGANGVATAVPNSDQTGLFWFFDAANIELIVKVLDGRPLNNAFWTFYGGLSDVQYWVSVTDVQSGETATYHNPPGNICGKADVGSFPQSGVAPAAAAAAAPALFEAAPATPATEALCAAGPNTLCLLGGRFQVEVDWRTGANSGAGTAIPYGDASGFFWFFDPANIELVVKVLDGRPLNGKFWFFYGALSDVAYDVKVTDTTAGAVRTYHNAQGNLCGRGDTAAF
jgi:hypothetical protein